MPLAELTITRGALDDHAIDTLAGEITEIFLDHQGARAGSPVAHSIACVEVNEVEPRRVYVGGRPATKPRYRVVFTVPVGALDEGRKASLARQATATILAAEGTPFSEEEGHRVWCVIKEVPDGNWASAGRIFRWRDIVRWVARGEIAARREAARLFGSARPAAEPALADRAAAERWAALAPSGAANVNH
jgi:phenylpyruvate tautomerase PptA (4-oxalocrotonate tautomerase family)